MKNILVCLFVMIFNLNTYAFENDFDIDLMEREELKTYVEMEQERMDREALVMRKFYLNLIRVQFVSSFAVEIPWIANFTVKPEIEFIFGR